MSQAATPRSLKAEILNAPNLISLARIGLIPIFLVFLAWESRLNSYIAATLFIVAGVSDLVDGFLARRLGLITVLGKFLDPIADKLMVMAAMVQLIALGRIPAWVVIVILSREFIISALRTLAMSEGVVIAAGQGGKWKTSLQVVGLIALIIHYPYELDFLIGQPVEVDMHRVGLWLIYLSLIPGILSAVEYFQGFWEEVQRREMSTADVAEAAGAQAAGAAEDPVPRHVSAEVADDVGTEA